VVRKRPNRCPVTDAEEEETSSQLWNTIALRMRYDDRCIVSLSVKGLLNLFKYALPSTKDERRNVLHEHLSRPQQGDDFHEREDQLVARIIEPTVAGGRESLTGGAAGH